MTPNNDQRRAIKRRRQLPKGIWVKFDPLLREYYEAGDPEAPVTRKTWDKIYEELCKRGYPGCATSLKRRASFLRLKKRYMTWEEKDMLTAGGTIRDSWPDGRSITPWERAQLHRFAKEKPPRPQRKRTSNKAVAVTWPQTSTPEQIHDLTEFDDSMYSEHVQEESEDQLVIYAMPISDSEVTVLKIQDEIPRYCYSSIQWEHERYALMSPDARKTRTPFSAYSKIYDARDLHRYGDHADATRKLVKGVEIIEDLMKSPTLALLGGLLTTCFIEFNEDDEDDRKFRKLALSFIVKAARDYLPESRNHPLRKIIEMVATLDSSSNVERLAIASCLADTLTACAGNGIEFDDNAHYEAEELRIKAYLGCEKYLEAAHAANSLYHTWGNAHGYDRPLTLRARRFEIRSILKMGQAGTAWRICQDLTEPRSDDRGALPASGHWKEYSAWRDMADVYVKVNDMEKVELCLRKGLEFSRKAYYRGSSEILRHLHDLVHFYAKQSSHGHVIGLINAYPDICRQLRTFPKQYQHLLEDSD